MEFKEVYVLVQIVYEEDYDYNCFIEISVYNNLDKAIKILDSLREKYKDKEFELRSRRYNVCLKDIDDFLIS